MVLRLKVMDINNQIISEYESKADIYNEFSKKLRSILEEELKKKKIDFDQCKERPKKEVYSLREKLHRKADKYKKLDDITDLSGARIVIYYISDIQKIGKLIPNEFDVIEEQCNLSSDRNGIDNFGYEDNHYVVTLKKDSKVANENPAFANIKAEIQVRTILQHAWDSISHNLIYKKENEVPTNLQRDFNAISAGLVIFDKAFIRFIDDLSKMRDEYRMKIENGDLNIEINKISIEEYLRHKKLFFELTGCLDGNLFIKNQNTTGKHSVYYLEMDSSSFIRKLESLGVNTIKELDDIFIEAINSSICAKINNIFVPFLKAKQRLIYQISNEHLRVDSEYKIFYGIYYIILLYTLLDTPYDNEDIIESLIKERYLWEGEISFYVGPVDLKFS
jgi:ppGpp synthetase/RelA/SpoT-type nucleotidyltranferase